MVLFGPYAVLTPDRRRDSFKLACLPRPVPGLIRSLSLAAGPGPPWSDFLWPFPRPAIEHPRPGPNAVGMRGRSVTDLTGRRGIETLAEDSDDCLLDW